MTTHGSSRRLLSFISLGVMTAFAIWCVLSLRIDLARISFSPIWRSWDILLVAASFSLINYVLRAIRWQWYLKRLGHSLRLRFSAVTYVAGFAFTLSPGKLGEVIRARYYTGMGISLRDVAATVFVERLMDLLAMLVLATLTITAFPRYEGAIWATGIAITTALVLLTASPWDAIANFIRHSRTVPRVLMRLGMEAAGTLANARSLLSLRAVVLGFLISFAAWGIEGVGLGILCRMVTPPQFDMSFAVGIYAIAVLVGALSFMPGGLGSTEAVMAALLATRGYSIADALLITLACRIVTLWFGVTLGWLAVIALRRS